jgi:hypothetical protein
MDVEKETTQRNSDFMEAYKARYLEQAASRAAFVSSTTFLRMRQSLIQNPKLLTLDSENFDYFPEQAKHSVGWDFAEKEDIKLFWDIVGDPDAKTVQAESVRWVTKNGFGRCTFQHYGLFVCLMVGQGTYLSVSNQPSAQ